MISLEELKRLHEEATSLKHKMIGMQENRKIVEMVTDKKMQKYTKRLKRYHKVHYETFVMSDEDEELFCYLRNHCEEIIKILEERHGTLG